MVPFASVALVTTSGTGWLSSVIFSTMRLMTILSSIIMFNTRNFKSSTFKISVGMFASVVIYYVNNFFNVMGKTEKIPIIFSVWGPIIFLIIINFIYTIKINEK